MPFRSTVKPVFKVHSGEPEYVPFMNSYFLYKVKIYALFINGMYRCPLRQV